jgi:hypothetical protein
MVDEFDDIARDLQIELGNNRIYGLAHPASAWAKNRHALRDHEAVRNLVRDVYKRADALNKRTQERYDSASHDEINDPEWQKLSDDEKKERRDALTAAFKAKGAVEDLIQESQHGSQSS